ncbi:hypothetical protein DN062_02620 [Nitrincola tibetensis]|uniref:Carrier domain-containing protein n=1 Tax=Nitrincola tibetensis TaxID=2219697 RepID=A0A364NQ93_9GAMM|nr:hypothetical protein [Nitrincola tibetensis]RAU19180.1 hypothetical protein DN062_02620 [Nitrincola tibetensis]
MSTQMKVLNTLILLLEQKAVLGTDRTRADIIGNPCFMLSDILDSVDKVEFFLLLENAFNINVPDQDQDLLETFAQVVEYVDKVLCP